MATQYDPTTFGWQNFYSAVLQSDITSGSLTLTLDTVPSSTSGILVIEPDSATNREVIFYTSKGASTITCPSDGRGWGGTTAVAHLTGSTVIMADVKSFFEGLGNGTLSSDPLRTALFYDYIVSGGVVAQSAGLVGTFSDIVFYLSGRRYAGTSIANKTYTASKDTYVDITGNSDGTVTVTYTEVANNAASPALSTNNLRIAVVTTNGSTITNVNQGQETQIIPIASSIAYSVTDSLGNLICPRDPNRKILSVRQIYSTYTSGSGATPVQVPGLSCPVIVPTGRKVRISLYAPSFSTSVGPAAALLGIWDGVVNSGTLLNTAQVSSTSNGYAWGVIAQIVITPSTTNKTYNAGISAASGNPSISAGSTSPAYLMVELV